MLKKNIGPIDRVLRIVVGLALLSLLVVVDGGARWIGLVGIIPLATAALGTCPLYTVLGLSTCPVQRGRA